MFPALYFPLMFWSEFWVGCFKANPLVWGLCQAIIRHTDPPPSGGTPLKKKRR